MNAFRGNTPAQVCNFPGNEISIKGSGYTSYPNDETILYTYHSGNLLVQPKSDTLAHEKV
ncbi:MAG: hypothetical protein ABIR15_20490 [Chitinophagaceae bacterium]